MTARAWRWIAWCYHLLFAAAVVWPGQALVNEPTPFMLGLPRQIVWIATWVVGSLVVLWRLDLAEMRGGRAASGSSDGSSGGTGASRAALSGDADG